MNCDRDSPESPTMDCNDDRVLDSNGKHPQELMGIELCLLGVFCLFVVLLWSHLQLMEISGLGVKSELQPQQCGIRAVSATTP